MIDRASTVARSESATYKRKAADGRSAYKRWLDLTVLILAHMLLLPVWLLLWSLIPLFIWLQDRGPVFYRQKRVGKDGRVFAVLKFRTMVPGADRYGPKWASPWAGAEYDPRVTRLGQILRRTGLDELPQVLNIWKGDMSLVGPRACPPEEQALLEQKVPGFRERLKVRPGLTGLAQLRDPSGEPHTRLRYDLEYIRRMSPLLDLKLLLLSVLYTLTGRWDRRSGKTGAP